MTLDDHQSLIDLGVSFGPTYITAAGFTAEQPPIPVARVRGSGAYQAYLRDTLVSEGVRIQSQGEWYIRQGGALIPAPPDTHGFDHAQAIFVDALQTIKRAAIEAVHHPLEIAAVSRPEHFNESSKQAVIEALMEVEPSSYRQHWQVIRSTVASWLAYGLFTCDGLGMDSAACDIDEGPHRVLIVEYQETYLQLFIVDVAAETCEIESRTQFHELGENAVFDAANAKWVGRLQKFLRDDNSDTVLTAHYAKIQDTLRDFLVEHEFIPGYPDSYTPGGPPVQRKSTTEYPDQWEFARAVVLSGDASESGFQALRSSVYEALSQHEDKMRNSIDPLYVEAMGAAQRGRHQVLNPGFLDDIISTNFVSWPERDEL
ncbi:MAG: hypothetical protein Q9224_005055 [Gallowayella concinna]